MESTARKLSLGYAWHFQTDTVESPLQPGNSSVLSVNITTARRYQNFRDTNMTTPNGRPVELPVWPDNCEKLCWSYEMFIDGVDERQTLNEHCRKFSLVLDDSGGSSVIENKLLLIITLFVCWFAR